MRLFRWLIVAALCVSTPALGYWKSRLQVSVGAAAFSPTSISGLALWVQPSLSAMYQSNSCSGTVASANGDPVGCIKDLSGNGFDLTSVADDTTRPLLQGVGSNPYLDFDGVNDVLKRGADLGLYSSGAQFSVWGCFKANPTAVARLVSETNNASTNQFVIMLQAPASPFSTEGEFYRNDAGTTITNNALYLTATTYWDNSVHVIGYTDTTTQLQGYKDGTGTGLQSYAGGSRAGSVTINQFSLGALLRVTAGGWMPARVYSLVAYKATLTGGNISNLNTYVGNTCGVPL